MTVASDMAPEEMSLLRRLMQKFLGEEAKELEHQDAAFNESDHPRDQDGKFGSGGGGGPKGLANHPMERMRDYTPKELDWEYEREYKVYAKNFAPNAFKDRADFQKKYDAAPLKHLSHAEFHGLQNTSGLGSMAEHSASKEEKEKYLRKQIGARRDVGRIYRDLEHAEHATAPPIVLKKGNTLRLMSGNTRLLAGASRGLNVPVKVIAVDEKLANDPPVSEEQRRAMWAAAKGHSTLGIPQKVGKEFVGDSANAAGVMVTSPNAGALLLRRSKGDHDGEWCFPGGGAEDDETPEETARRELEEETGYRGGELKPLARRDADGVNFLTFGHETDEPFDPRLNDEHDAHVWATPDKLPEPLHPGVKAFFDARQAQDAALAFDRSARTIDKDGRLHVALTNISKANVCPYYGREIPNASALGLEPDRKYMLLRAPDELEKAVATFNGLPVLFKHKPTSAEDHPKEITVGATGDSAVFEAPYLKNSLHVWTQEAIDGIENEDQCELSCSYHYDPDMTPGTYLGQPYDGVMRNIKGNHVALVEEGRAGPDVVVGDSQIGKETRMKTKLGRHLLGALHGLMGTASKDALLAMDKAVGTPTAKTWTKDKPRIITALDGLKGKKVLANDADLERMHGFIDRLDQPSVNDAEAEEDKDGEKPEEPGGEDAEEEEEKKKKAAMDWENSPEYKQAKDAYEKRGKDSAAPPPFKDKPETGAQDSKPITKADVDAAIKVATDHATARQVAIREAERAVRPWVGELAMAFDSAAAVYRSALTTLGIKDVGKLHDDALPHVLQHVPKPNETRREVPVLAADAAAVDSFNKMFPGASRVRMI